MVFSEHGKWSPFIISSQHFMFVMLTVIFRESVKKKEERIEKKEINSSTPSKWGSCVFFFILWIIPYCGSLPRPRRVWLTSALPLPGARISHASSTARLACVGGQRKNFVFYSVIISLSLRSAPFPKKTRCLFFKRAKTARYSFYVFAVLWLKQEDWQDKQ